MKIHELITEGFRSHEYYQLNPIRRGDTVRDRRTGDIYNVRGFEGHLIIVDDGDVIEERYLEKIYPDKKSIATEGKLSGEIDNIVSMYASGKSYNEIARRYGVDRKTIAWHITRQPNYPELRAQHWSVAPYEYTGAVNFGADEQRRMHEMYLAGHSFEEIGRKFGITGDNAAQNIRKYDPNLAITARERVPLYKPGITRIAKRSLEENDDDHRQQLQKTGFWGRRGAGCLFLARDTKRICIAHRSEHVEQPGTWGTWGGAIDGDESPEVAVQREAHEEAGYSGAMKLVPLYVFKHSSGFTYYNYLAVIESEFTPQLDWETQGYKWITYPRWPQPLHMGMKLLLADPTSVATIEQYCQQ